MDYLRWIEEGKAGWSYLSRETSYGSLGKSGRDKELLGLFEL